MASKKAELIRKAIIKESENPTTTYVEERLEWENFAKEEALPKTIQFTRMIIESIHCELFEKIDGSSQGLILYFHGGGYVSGSCITYRTTASKYVIETGMKVLVFDYPLAPEHPYPEAINASVRLYNALKDRGYKQEDIVFVGDSAGGGLILATLLQLKETAYILPNKVVLISPWTDMTLSGDSVRTRYEQEPQLSVGGLKRAAEAYVKDVSLKNPFVSPIFADLSGLPDLFIHVGDDEILLDDSIRLAEKAQEDGLKVTIKVWPDMWHSFVGYDIPEAIEAIHEMAMFINDKG